MPQIGIDLDQSLAKPRMGRLHARGFLSLFDTNQTFSVGIPSRSRKDELTDPRLSLENEDASPTCQSTWSEAKRRLDLAQRQTQDIPFDREVALDVFHYKWLVIVTCLPGNAVIAKAFRRVSGQRPVKRHIELMTSGVDLGGEPLESRSACALICNAVR